MSRLQIAARITSPQGTSRMIHPVGRDAWALLELVAAGEKGCTPIDNPAPRWSHYVWKLRHDYGVAVETIEESHGGTFSGTHARYVLLDKVEILGERKVA